ncbi:unnamed protein product [Mytilus edulis]|uniref:Uncharacterized protein n=1 Tax=Mytilus edulis TaxID=6550 RepID=A0A8S3U5K8_MYTED|nr:unnamed protein product [Mytilus edulis]
MSQFSSSDQRRITQSLNVRPSPNFCDPVDGTCKCESGYECNKEVDESDGENGRTRLEDSTTISCIIYYTNKLRVKVTPASVALHPDHHEYGIDDGHYCSIREKECCAYYFKRGGVCEDSSVLVDSQQVGSDTNRGSIHSTTNDMNLKDEKDTGTRFNYKEILMDIIPFVVLAFVILVIGSILKRANDSCKRYEVDSIADNKSHHDGNNETGSKTTITLSFPQEISGLHLCPRHTVPIFTPMATR